MNHLKCMKLFLFFAIVNNLTCSGFYEEHEKPVSLEWRIISKSTQQPIKDTTINFVITAPKAYWDQTDYVDTGKIDIQGFLLCDFYISPYFDEKNGVLLLKLYKNNTTILDTSISWNKLVFKYQSFDTTHDYQSNYAFYLNTCPKYGICKNKVELNYQ